MPTRKATATWEGTLKRGNGSMAVESGAFEVPYNFQSRFEEGDATNPEELIGAAHAGCFSMSLANKLDQAGYTPERVDTTAEVTVEQVEGAFAITTVVLTTEAAVSDVDEATFLEIAEDAKNGCPVSKALAGVDISLNATLL